MWTKRPLTDNLFFHLCGEILDKVHHSAVGAIITMGYQIHWLVDAIPVLYRAHHPAVGAIINMGYQVRREVCVAIADEVATLSATGE